MYDVREQVSTPAAEKVNLNTADVEELTTLPGIGPSLAERIVEYRRQNDGFRKIEDPLVTLQAPKVEVDDVLLTQAEFTAYC